MEDPRIVGWNEIRASMECTMEFQNEIGDMFNQEIDAFYKEGEVLNITNVLEHRIPMREGQRPVNVPQFPIALSLINDLRPVLIRFRDRMNIFEPAMGSQWNSPIMPVEKKEGGEPRIVSCLGGINKVTIARSAFGTPRTDRSLEALAGMMWYSKADLMKGFWQVAIAKEDRDKTAFNFPGLGQLRYVRMTMGLSGAPATWNQLMHEVLSGLEELRSDEGKLTSVLIWFFDDLGWGSCSESDHIKHIQLVLRRFKECNLTLNIKKTEIFKREIKFLRRLVSMKGIRILDSDVQEFLEIPRPMTAEGLSSVLGMLNHFGNHLEGEKHITAPLYDLVASTLRTSSKRRVKKSRSAKAGMRTMEDPKRGGIPIEWSTDNIALFERMRTIVKTNKWLASPVVGVEGREFVLSTDASQLAIGGVLQQRQLDNSLAPIGFFSRTLRAYQKHYEVTVKEALAVVESLHHFRPIIFGQKLEILTDHSALVNVLNGNAVSTDMLERWRAIVNIYAPWSVRYIPGKENKLGDWASRHVASEFRRWGEAEDDLVERVLGVQELKPIAQRDQESDNVEQDWALQIMEEGNAEDTIRKLQLEDSALQKLIMLHQGDAKGSKIDLGGLKESIMHKGQLWKRVNGELRLWIPTGMIPMILDQIHKVLGHAGTKATLREFNTKFYAVGITTLVDEFIRECDSCGRFKSNKYTNKGIRTGPVGEDAPHSGHTWIMDMKGPLPTTKKRNTMIVSFVDPITRWPEMFATTNGNSDTIMHCLLLVIARHGFPRRIIHDQGSNFMSQAMVKLLDRIGTTGLPSTPYSPWIQGKVERCQGIIASILYHFLNVNKDNWDDHLPYALLAMRMRVNRMTGKSPAELLYGRRLEGPLEGSLDLPAQATPDANSIADCLHEASQLAEGRRKPMNEFSDKKISVGDLVRVRVPVVGLKNPFGTERWEGRYIVSDLHGRNEAIIQSGTGKPRTVSLYDLRVIEAAEKSKLKVRLELAGDESD